MGSPAQIVWNTLACTLLGVAAVCLALPRSRPLRPRLLVTVLWVLALGTSVLVAGYYVPVGPVVVLAQVRATWTQPPRTQAVPRPDGAAIH